MQKIQIIKRKVDPSHFDGTYFKQIRSSIQKTRNRNAELLFIEFIPNMPIQERSATKIIITSTEGVYRYSHCTKNHFSIR